MAISLDALWKASRKINTPVGQVIRHYGKTYFQKTEEGYRVWANSPKKSYAQCVGVIDNSGVFTLADTMFVGPTDNTIQYAVYSAMGGTGNSYPQRVYAHQRKGATLNADFYVRTPQQGNVALVAGTQFSINGVINPTPLKELVVSEATSKKINSQLRKWSKLMKLTATLAFDSLKDTYYFDKAVLPTVDDEPGGPALMALLEHASSRTFAKTWEYQKGYVEIPMDRFIKNLVPKALKILRDKWEHEATDSEWKEFTWQL